MEPVGWVTWGSDPGGSAVCAEGPGTVPVAEDTIAAVWVGKELRATLTPAQSCCVVKWEHVGNKAQCLK